MKDKIKVEDAVHFEPYPYSEWAINGNTSEVSGVQKRTPEYNKGAELIFNTC